MNTAIQEWKRQEEEAREELDFLQNKFSIVSIQKFQLNAKIEKNVNQQIVLRQHISSNQEEKYDNLARFEIDCLEVELKGMQSAFDKISLIDQQTRTEMDRQSEKVKNAAELTQIAIEESKEGDYQMTVFSNSKEVVN